MMAMMTVRRACSMWRRRRSGRAGGPAAVSVALCSCRRQLGRTARERIWSRTASFCRYQHGGGC